MILGVVLLAAGTGARFGADIPKQFIPLNGRPVWQYSYDVLRGHADVEGIVVMFPPGYITGPRQDVITGGHTRRESSFLGVKALLEINPKITHIMIHDAARPFITKKIIDDCVDALEDGYDAVDVTIKSADSIAQLDESEKFITAIPNRDKMRLGQTPQCFKAEEIYDALKNAPAIPFTDDIGILLHQRPNSKIKNVDGSDENMKITTQSDLIKAERIANKTLHKPELDLKGKRALVLGASGGIGAAVVEELKERGVSEIYTPSIRGKVPYDIAMNVPGVVDIVVDCVGQLTKGEFLSDKDVAFWEDEFRINFIWKVEFMSAFIKMGKLRPRGAFVFVGSSSAYHGRPEYSAYCSAKAALMSFVQAVGSEENYVRINLVNPGRCNTPMRKRMFGQEDEDGLATPKQVAIKIVDVCGMDCSGSIFDVRANEIDT